MPADTIEDIVLYFWNLNAELRAASEGGYNYFKIEYSVLGTSDTDTRLVNPDIPPNITELNPKYTVCITQIRQYVAQKKYKTGDLVKLNINTARGLFTKGSIVSQDTATGRYQVRTNGKKLYLSANDISPLDLCNNCGSANKSFLHISGGVSIENMCVYLNLMNHIIIDKVAGGPGLVLTNASLIVRNISGYGSCDDVLVVEDCEESPPKCVVKSDCCLSNKINLCKSECLCGGLAFIINCDINTYGLCKLQVDGSSIDLGEKKFAQCPNSGYVCNKNGGECGGDKILASASLSPPCPYYKINLFMIDSVVRIYLLPKIYTDEICNKNPELDISSYDTSDISSCNLDKTTTTDHSSSCKCDTEDVVPKVINTVGEGYFEVSDAYSNSNLFVNKLTQFNLVRHAEFNLKGENKTWCGFLNLGGTRALYLDGDGHSGHSSHSSHSSKSHANMDDICSNYNHSSEYGDCDSSSYEEDDVDLSRGCVFGECNNVESVPWCYIHSADFYLPSLVASVLNGTFDKFGRAVEVKYIPNNNPCISGCKRSYVKVIKYHGINRYLGQLNISVCGDNTLPIKNSNVYISDCGDGDDCNTVTFFDENDSNIGCDDDEDPNVNLSVVISAKKYLSQYDGDDIPSSCSNNRISSIPPGTPLLLINSWLLKNTKTNYEDQIFTDENCNTSAKNYHKQRIIVFYSPDQLDDDDDNCYALAINPKKKKKLANYVYIGGDYGKYCYY